MPLQRRSRVAASDRARTRGAFAAAVTARRLELELTQAELADLAGVTRGPVVALEAGRPVSFDVLLAALDVLGLHLELTRGTVPSGVSVSAELSDRYHLRGVERIGDHQDGPDREGQEPETGDSR